MGGHGGHVRRQQRGGHEPQQSGGHEAEHGGVGEIVPDQTRVGVGKRLPQGGQVGKHHQRGQRHEDPGPGTEGVMGDVEEQGGRDSAPFRPRGQHALGDVSAAARFGAGIPDAPPLDRQRQHQQQEEGLAVAGVGHQAQFRRHRRVSEQTRQSAHIRPAQDHHRGADGAGHGQDELEEIRQQDAAEAAQRAVDHRHDAGEKQGPSGGPVQDDRGDLRQGHGYRGQHQHVEESPEVHGAEAAQEGRRPAAVTQLVELQVGEDAGTPPQPGVDEHGEHARQEERPPGPVAGDAVLADHVGDQVRRVAGKRGRHHGYAEQPPRHAPAGEEELGGAAPCPPRHDQPDEQREDEISDDDAPVKRVQDHAVRLRCLFAMSQRTGAAGAWTSRAAGSCWRGRSGPSQNTARDLSPSICR